MILKGFDASMGQDSSESFWNYRDDATHREKYLKTCHGKTSNFSHLFMYFISQFHMFAMNYYRRSHNINTITN